MNKFKPNAAAGIFGGAEDGDCGCGSGSSSSNCCDCTFITQTPCGSLTNEQALSLLQTGLLKNTTATGVLSIATIGVDYSAPIVVREVDGDPSVTPVTTIEFDQDDGFVLSDQGSGVVRLNFVGGGAFNLTVQDSDTSPSFANINTIRFPSSKGFTLSSPGAGIVLVDQVDTRKGTVTFAVRNDDGLTAGIKGESMVDFDGVIEAVTVVGDEGATGDIEWDIQKTNFAGYDGSFASIVASAPPTITSNNKSQDSTLTGWTLSFTAGTIFRFIINSVSGFNRSTVFLRVRRI